MSQAQGYLGQARPAQEAGPAAGARPPDGIPEPASPCRIPAFGRPVALLGAVKGPDDPSPRPVLGLAGRGTRWSMAAEASAARSTTLIVGLLFAAVLAMMLGGRRPAGAASLLLALAVAGFSGGPAALAGGLGVAAAARRAGRDRDASPAPPAATDL